MPEAMHTWHQDLAALPAGAADPGWLFVAACIVWAVVFSALALYGLWHFSVWATDRYDPSWAKSRAWWKARSPRRSPRRAGRMRWWAYRRLRQVCPHPLWRQGIYRNRRGCLMATCLDCKITWHQTNQYCAHCDTLAVS